MIDHKIKTKCYAVCDICETKALLKNKTIMINPGLPIDWSRLIVFNPDDMSKHIRIELCPDCTSAHISGAIEQVQHVKEMKK